MFEQQRYYEYSRRKVVIAIAVSALIHIPALLMLSLLEPDHEELTTTEFSAKRALQVNVVREDPTKKKEKKKEDPDTKLQHVSAPKPEVEKTPEEAQFADRYASEVEKQTVRKKAPGAPIPIQEITPVPPSDNPDPDLADSVPQKVEEINNPVLEVEDEGQKPTQQPKEGVVVKNRDVSDGKQDSKTTKNLFPQLANSDLYNPNGQGGSLDYLRDVAEGEKTLLNRKRSRYWAFFDRVKKQISKQWAPHGEYRRRDPYGNVYGVKDRYSAVSVTLNADGSVRQLYIHRESGLDFFDDEAIRSIRSAAPFHNPPEGLKDEDGLVHFTFGFYFEIQSGRFQMRRLFQ